MRGVSVSLSVLTPFFSSPTLLIWPFCPLLSPVILCQDCRSAVRGLAEKGGPHQVQNRLHLPCPGCVICSGTRSSASFSRHDKTTAGGTLGWGRGFLCLRFWRHQSTMAGRYGSRSWGVSLAVRKLSDPRGTRSGDEL